MKEVGECEALIETLPYNLTKAQGKVWDEVKADLTKDIAMNRLIQGDVGSGKTIIAILALLMAVKNGYQASFMVPTEVLAKQHYKSLLESLGDFGISVCLLWLYDSKEKRDKFMDIKP